MDSDGQHEPHCNRNGCAPTESTVAADLVIGSRFQSARPPSWPQQPTEPSIPPGPMAWPASALPRYGPFGAITEVAFSPSGPEAFTIPLVRRVDVMVSVPLRVAGYQRRAANVSEDSLNFQARITEISKLDLAIVWDSASRSCTPCCAGHSRPCHQLCAGGRHRRGHSTSSS